MAIIEGKRMKDSRLAKSDTGVLRRDCTLVDLLRTFLNYSIAVEKEHNDKFVAALIVKLLKFMMDPGFLTRLAAQSYNRYVLVFKTTLKHDGTIFQAERLNKNDAGAKSLIITNLDGIGLYTATTEKPVILIRATSNFVKKLTKLNPFHFHRCHTIPNKFLGTEGTIFRTPYRFLFGV